MGMRGVMGMGVCFDETLRTANNIFNSIKNEQLKSFSASAAGMLAAR